MVLTKAWSRISCGALRSSPEVSRGSQLGRCEIRPRDDDGGVALRLGPTPEARGDRATGAGASGRSCNRETGHLWFNVELANKHPDSLEYLVVHEMTHLLERSHGERFTTLMDRQVPDWRSRRDNLNDAPLADEWRTSAS